MTAPVRLLALGLITAASTAVWPAAPAAAGLTPTPTPTSAPVQVMIGYTCQAPIGSGAVTRRG